jgi:hypothetical protein
MKFTLFCLKVFLIISLLNQILSECWTEKEKNINIGKCQVKSTLERCYDKSHGWRWRMWIRAEGKEASSGYVDSAAKAKDKAIEDFKAKYPDCLASGMFLEDEKEETKKLPFDIQTIQKENCMQVLIAGMCVYCCD